MKQQIILFVFLACAVGNSCKKNTIDDQSTVFIKYFGSAKTSEGFDLKQTPDGGYILVGSTSVKDTEVKNVLVVKTDAKGNQQWIKTFGEGLTAEGKSIQLTNDGGYAIIGTSGNRIYLLKIDESGNVTLKRTLDYLGSGSQEGVSLQIRTDGDYIIAGSTDVNSNGNRDILVLKASNISGDSIWTQKASYSNDDYANKLQIINDSTFYILGTNNSLVTDTAFLGYNIFPLKSFGGNNKTRAPGLNQSLNQVGGINNDFGASIKLLANGDIIIVGTESESILVSQMYDKYNPPPITGETPGLVPRWKKTIPKEGGLLTGKDIDLAEDGGFIIAGNYTSGSNTDQYLLKTDGSGNKIWEETFGSTDTDVANAVIATSDGGYAFIGSTTLGGYSVMTLVKVTATGELKK